MRRSRGREQAEDVESYTRARWADAVRTLVELGATVPQAELVTRTAFVRTWRSWRQEHRSGDVDVLVYAALLRAWGWPQDRPEVGADRVARVLVAQARLSDHAAERITGSDPGGLTGGPRLGSRLGSQLGSQLGPLLGDWSPDDEDVYRGVAPMAEIRDDLRRRRRRTTTRVAAGTVAAAALAGLVVVLGADPAPPERRPVVANPLPLAWWTQGTLHLGRSELAVPGLVALAQAGQGASYAVVFGDERGRVFQVDDLSDPVLIGESAVGAQLSASLDGRAAWVDVSDPTPQVVVWDTAAGEVLDRLPLTDATSGRQTEVVALDGDLVYLSSPAGTSRWVLGESILEPVTDRVVDASSGVLVAAATPAGSGQVESGQVESGQIVAGPDRFEVGADHQATLSPGGLVAAAWVPQEPALTLAGAGPNLSAVPLQLPSLTGIVEARFAPDGDLVLVLLKDRGGSGGKPALPLEAPVTVATCVLQTGTCDEVVRLEEPADPTADVSPVLLAR